MTRRLRCRSLLSFRRLAGGMFGSGLAFLIVEVPVSESYMEAPGH